MKQVLLIYRRMIPSIRLCAHAQLSCLAEQGIIGYRAVQDMRLTAEELNRADIAVLGRLDSWYELQITKKLHAAGKYLIYMMDDDLLNVPAGVSSASYYNQESIRRCIGEIIGLSDAVLSPSPALLEKYAGGKRGILIEEPALLPAPFIPHRSDEPVKIGFAGSADRTQDLEQILGEALTSIRKEYGDRVRFEFFGAAPSFAENIGAKCIPYTESYERYRETLNGLAWDIGLAPMPDTPFHACKHYNKFAEYAAAGIAGIYSDTGPYRRLEAFPGCAVLSRNTAEAWTAAMRLLLEDEALREGIRRKASECARRELSTETCAASLREQISGCGSQAAGKIQGALLPLKAANAWKRLLTSLRGHGAAGFLKHTVKVVLRR